MLLDLARWSRNPASTPVWVGDSLFSKPRYEPISLLSAISQRTSRVQPRDVCMVSSTRNPLYLALEWATLDVISGGRTIFGTGMGNPEEGVRREFEALGLDYVRRGTLFEEGLAVLRAAVDRGSRHASTASTSTTTTSPFHSGTEMAPLHADPEAAADLGRLQPATERRRRAGRHRAAASTRRAGASSATATAG